MMQRQGTFDESCCAGSRLGMTNLRLNRSQGAPGIQGLPVHLTQGFNFHCIANFGTGTMGLNKTDTLRGNASPLVGIIKRLFLSSGTGGVNSIASAITGGTYPANDCVYSVTITLRIG